MKTAEEILKSKLSVTDWNFLEHVLHSGECYKQILSSLEEFASQERESQTLRIKELESENSKLKMMIENGLGWEDMINDITMPHEI